MKFYDHRKEYTSLPLSRDALDPDPIQEMALWLEQAAALPIEEFNAMALATATAEGRPSTRMVLLKELDEEGLIFFTNYNSRKGIEIEANPYASATFYWRELTRQLSVEGRIEKLDAEKSDSYFESRSRASQLAVWCSDQSSPLLSREKLEESYKRYEERFHLEEIPRPSHWGGYRLLPEQFRFWQGREHRLHDLFSYKLERSGQWWLQRLSP